MALDKFMKKCSICGKPFYCDNVELWTYKKAYKRRDNGGLAHSKVRLFCSYHCAREYEKAKEVRNGKV